MSPSLVHILLHFNGLFLAHVTTAIDGAPSQSLSDILVANFDEDHYGLERSGHYIIDNH